MRTDCRAETDPTAAPSPPASPGCSAGHPAPAHLPLRHPEIESFGGQPLHVTLQCPDAADLADQTVAGAVVAFGHRVMQQLPRTRNVRPPDAPRAAATTYRATDRRPSPPTAPKAAAPAEVNRAAAASARKFEGAHRRHRTVAADRGDHPALAHDGDTHLGVDTAHGPAQIAFQPVRRNEPQRPRRTGEKQKEEEIVSSSRRGIKPTGRAATIRRRSSSAPRRRRLRSAAPDGSYRPRSFLSLVTAASNRSAGTGGSVAKPSAASSRTMRSHAAGASPSFTASRAAIAMPTATASPWIISREHFSTAWPNVWPRLSFRRSPCSRSSRLTTAALSRTECTTTLSMASGSAQAVASPTRSISPKSGSSPMIPALTASASPARISRREASRRATCRRRRTAAGRKRPPCSCTRPD